MGPTGGRSTGQEDALDFFLPDLCSTRSVFLMVVLGELLVLVHVLATSDLPRYNWPLLASASLVVQWVMLLSAAILCRLRRPLSELSLTTAVVWCLIVVAVVTLATSFLLIWLPGPFASYETTSWHLLRNVLIALLIAAILLRYFYLQQQLRRQEKLELQARLDSLRDRIRPHFLFNTLNSIASLIMSRPAAAEEAVEDLSELFRSSLHDERGVATVDDELRLCELYLKIEKLRLGERLQVDWQVTEAVRSQPMPSLILQPLVENAIYHGISRLPEGGKITIEVRLTALEVLSRVDNPSASGEPAPQGHRIALDNIRQRLDALYGSLARIEISPEADTFSVLVRYPREDLA